MNDNDKQQFWTALKITYEAYGKYPSATQGRVWWEALKPYEFINVKNALSKHVNDSVWLPRVAEIRKIIDLAEATMKARQRTVYLEHKMTPEQRASGLAHFKEMTKEIFGED